jgi:hypothetical protein
MHRTEVINILAEKINAKTYLEIGVRDHKDNFNDVNIESKISVDIEIEPYDREPDFIMTSDSFFEQNDKNFDLIFVDGLHESKQLESDILNSIEILNEGGYVVCHDTNPTVYERQLTHFDKERIVYVHREKLKGNPQYGLWNGDIWKSIVRLRSSRDDLNFFTVDTDFGMTAISKGFQEKLNTKESELKYKNLQKNRKEWLNLISIDEFKSLFK